LNENYIYKELTFLYPWKNMAHKEMLTTCRFIKDGTFIVEIFITFLSNLSLRCTHQG
jgi:hypothetical protein